MERRPESLVIGAGPAGLAVAACLRKRRGPFAIVEQAADVGSTWRRHYERLHLHTDRDHSALPYFGFPLCGSRISPVGMLYEIGVEAQRIAADIDRISSAPTPP